MGIVCHHGTARSYHDTFVLLFVTFFFHDAQRASELERERSAAKEAARASALAHRATESKLRLQARGCCAGAESINILHLLLCFYWQPARHIGYYKIILIRV